MLLCSPLWKSSEVEKRVRTRKSFKWLLGQEHIHENGSVQSFGWDINISNLVSSLVIVRNFFQKKKERKRASPFEMLQFHIHLYSLLRLTYYDRRRMNWNRLSWLILKNDTSIVCKNTNHFQHHLLQFQHQNGVIFYITIDWLKNIYIINLCLEGYIDGLLLITNRYCY